MLLPRYYNQSFPSPLSVNSYNSRIIINNSFTNTSIRFIYSINIIINIITNFISIINIIIKISNSSLFLPSISEPSLPILLPGLPSLLQGLYYFQLYCTRLQPQLPKSDLLLFKDSLFSCILLDTIPPTVQLKYIQPVCNYSLKPYSIDYSSTSNYWIYYKSVYPEVAILYNQNIV
jgi:hypothetical protein